MLEKPNAGWGRLRLFDVDMEIGCDCDWDAPLIWLKACKYGLEHKLPITLHFDSGEESAMVIADENRTNILYNDYHGEEFFYVYESYNRMNLAEDIIMDINRDFDSWIAEWFAYESYERYLSREDMEFRNKCIWGGEYFRENERLELHLKTALREAESVWLKKVERKAGEKI